MRVLFSDLLKFQNRNNMFVVYKTTYLGEKMPKFYVGSTSIKKIESGKYYGSVSSRKWKEIFNEELKNNKHLFSVEILSKHLTRKEALKEELRIQIELNVVKSNDFINQSLASPNGFFGMNISGNLHPMFGKHHKLSTKEKIRNTQSNRTYIDKVGLEKATQWIEKSRKSNTGKKRSEILKNKFKGKNNGFFNKTHSIESRDKMRLCKLGKPSWNKGKIILKFNLDNQLLEEITLDKMPLNHKPNIVKCCKGQRKSAFGFIWKYKDI